MKVLKNFSEFSRMLAEGGDPFADIANKKPQVNTGSSSSGTKTNTKTNTNTNKPSGDKPAGDKPAGDKPAATGASSEVAKIVAELDGIALWFSDAVSEYAKYNKAQMSQYDGYFDDDEAGYWGVVKSNMTAAGAQQAQAAWNKAYTIFGALTPEQKTAYPEYDVVKGRMDHNNQEVDRIMAWKDGEYNKPGGPTLQGQIRKMVNMDDHWFKWTMYYSNTSVIPWKGSTAKPVKAVEPREVDCDF